VTSTAVRIWRLRKLHSSVDAHLRPLAEGMELTFLFNGEPSLSRICASREIALAEAAAKRAELEREGWMFHW
jgi:hypothetical protein